MTCRFDPDLKDDVSTYEGVARVVYLLAVGKELTTAQAAELMDRHRTTAYRFLCRLEASHRVPVFFNEDTGTWKINRPEE